MTDGERFLVFSVVWIVLAAINGWLVFRASLAVKRKWTPRLVVGVGVLLLGFLAWGATVTFVAGATLVVALLTFLNLKSIKFCSACSAYYFHFGRVSKDSYCMKCGHNHKEGSATKGAA
jgi:hypothetical protein